MRNLTVYIGTIKKCLDIKNYKKDGESTFIPEFQIGTSTTSITMGTAKPNVKTINNQAILIENEYGHFYNYELSNGVIDNLKIILDDSSNIINSTPNYNDELFYDEKSLVPYYEEQPKKLSFRKLKNDLLCDSRIKTGIEH